jgi:hypothetical protein
MDLKSSSGFIYYLPMCIPSILFSTVTPKSNNKYLLSFGLLQSSASALVAWCSGHRLRRRNGRSWVRISPGVRLLYTAQLSFVTEFALLLCVVLVKYVHKCEKYFLILRFKRKRLVTIIKLKLKLRKI